MQIRKNNKTRMPGISTASLPDIVFMLLFFFMVTTVMRETAMKVQVRSPKATEVARLERKSLVAHICIGPPINALKDKWGTEPRLQLNDAISEPKDVQYFVQQTIGETDQVEVPLLTYSMKVDQKTKMKIVTQVKQELRKAQALKINYSAKKMATKN